MKKIIVVVATVLICITNTVNAQDEQCFKKGTSAINLGVGFGNTLSYYAPYSGYGFSASPLFAPAFTASYEYGITHLGIGVISAGLQMSVQATHYDYASLYYANERESWTTVGICPRAAYHFDFLNKKKFDVYAIVGVGIYIDSYTDKVGSSVYSSSTNVYARPTVLAAARYFFVPAFGVFAEVGYDVCVAKLGLSLKFGGK